MNRWKALGAKPADMPVCDFYAKKLKASGWSDRDIDEAIAFGLKHQDAGWDKFQGLAIHELHKRGVDGSVVNEVLTPGDIIMENADIQDALAAESFATAFAAGNGTAPAKGDERIAEIQKLMKKDPHRYWRDERLQAEFAGLLEAKESGTATARSPINPRRGEIEAMMRDDPRAYWGNPEIQKEFAAIVAADVPSQEGADVGA